MSSFKKGLMWLGITITSLIVITLVVLNLSHQAPKGITEPVEKQLIALREDNIKLAYSYTSKDFQQATSLNDFRRYVNFYSSLKTNENATFSKPEMENNQGILKGTLYGKNGERTPIEFRLIKEEDKWKILSIDMQPTDATNENLQASNTSSSSTTEPSSTPMSSSSTTNKTTSFADIELPKLFEDKNNKYSINYPADWIYEQPEKGTIVFSGKKGTPGYYSTVNIQTVLTKKSGGHYKDLQDFMDNLKKQAKIGSHDVNFLGEGSIDVSEAAHGMKMHGRYLVFTYIIQDQRFNQIQFVFLRNDDQVFYAWAYTSPEEQYKIYYPIAKAMFSTWVVH